MKEFFLNDLTLNSLNIFWKYFLDCKVFHNALSVRFLETKEDKPDTNPRPRRKSRNMGEKGGFEPETTRL